MDSSSTLLGVSNLGTVVGFFAAAAKSFWLFYISPVRHKGEKGLASKVMLCGLHFVTTAMISMLGVIISLVAMYITFLLMKPIKPWLEGLNT